MKSFLVLVILVICTQSRSQSMERILDILQSMSKESELSDFQPHKVGKCSAGPWGDWKCCSKESDCAGDEYCGYDAAQKNYYCEARMWCYGYPESSITGACPTESLTHKCGDFTAAEGLCRTMGCTFHKRSWQREKAACTGTVSAKLQGKPVPKWDFYEEDCGFGALC
jgi:hypothetical protein